MVSGVCIQILHLSESGHCTGKCSVSVLYYIIASLKALCVAF